MATLLEHFRRALVDAGAPVRDPRDAPAAGEHPLWLEARGGAINIGGRDLAVEGDDDLVLTAYRVPGLSTGAWEGDQYRFDNVQLWIRCRVPPLAYDVEEAIRPILHDRRDWMMAGVKLIESMIAAELAPMGFGDGSFTFRVEYSLQRYIAPVPALP